MNAIEETEFRLNAARRDARSGLSRAHARLRENLVHPITLVSVAGVSAVLSYRLLSPHRHPAPRGADSPQPRSRSPWSTLLTLAMRVLPFVLWRARLAQLEHAAVSE